LGKHNLIKEPFLVCSIDDFLDNKLYKELFDTFPDRDFFVNPNTILINLDLIYQDINRNLFLYKVR